MFHNMYAVRSVWNDDYINLDEMGGVCSWHGRGEN
jgi:hypothetical protein